MSEMLTDGILSLEQLASIEEQANKMALTAMRLLAEDGKSELSRKMNETQLSHAKVILVLIRHIRAIEEWAPMEVIRWPQPPAADGGAEPGSKS